MPDNILVAIAWPYANADIHVGNIAGSHLPGDIFARYHRLRGNNVLVVSGSDSHGTPVAVRADADGSTPLAVYQHFHRRFLELFLKAGITYDLFTSTHTENHFHVSQDIFLKLQENGYLYTDSEPQWYSPAEKRFLPDRYVEGECYLCHYPNARGDQCDNCGNLLEAAQLINPRAKASGAKLELRETEHFYLDLAKAAPALSRWLHQGKDHWRPQVLNAAIAQVDSGELRGRAITRDLDWGIPVPVDGWAGKCLYVWFEAVIGYFSASIEWARNRGQPEAWKDWWYEPAARTVYFIGKDNTPFHAVIWPAELLGIERLYEPHPARRLNLPYDVPANEFLNLEAQKISGSRNWAVWGLDFLERYDPDALRYYLTAILPETRDSEWEWAGFVQHNNDELVATWGNLANRVLTFAYRHWEGHVPDPFGGSPAGDLGALRPQDRALLATIEAGFEKVGKLIEAVKLRAALGEVVALATEANRYLDAQGPWFEVKQDKAEAARTVYTALRAIDSLKILFAPFLPFSAQALHSQLGYDGRLFGTQKIETYAESAGAHEALTHDAAGAIGRWEPSRLPAGQALGQPTPLFKKLDPKTAEQERARLG